MSIEISVCIICQNESKNIAKCLESVLWADEIVVLDSGSTDDTLAVVKQYTDKVFISNNWQGFGEQRRRVEDLASYDWIFAIDADEVVPEALANEILQTKDLLQNNTVYRVNRLTNFCGQFIRHSGWYPDKIVRLYNKKIFRYNNKLVHESVACQHANAVDFTHNLLHYTFAELSVYLHKRTFYAEEWAKEKYKNGKKSSLTKGLFSAIFAFIRHYVIRLGFLDGRIGFLIAQVQFQYTFSKYALLQHKHLSAKSIKSTKSING